jgi:hypothetical protein
MRLRAMYSAHVAPTFPAPITDTFMVLIFKIQANLKDLNTLY